MKACGKKEWKKRNERQWIHTTFSGNFAVKKKEEVEQKLEKKWRQKAVFVFYGRNHNVYAWRSSSSKGRLAEEMSLSRWAEIWSSAQGKSQPLTETCMVHPWQQKGRQSREYNAEEGYGSGILQKRVSTFFNFLRGIRRSSTEWRWKEVV